MMTNYDISDIESAFMSIVKTAGVSSNVYPNRPKSVTKSQDFVVVRLGTSWPHTAPAVYAYSSSQGMWRT